MYSQLWCLACRPLAAGWAGSCSAGVRACVSRGGIKQCTGFGCSCVVLGRTLILYRGWCEMPPAARGEARAAHAHMVLHGGLEAARSAHLRAPRGMRALPLVPAGGAQGLGSVRARRLCGVSLRSTGSSPTSIERYIACVSDRPLISDKFGTLNLVSLAGRGDMRSQADAPMGQTMHSSPNSAQVRKRRVRDQSDRQPRRHIARPCKTHVGWLHSGP